MTGISAMICHGYGKSPQKIRAYARNFPSRKSFFSTLLEGADPDSLPEGHLHR